MANTDTDGDSLSALVVKEAVERGLETPLRDPILEAVEESEGGMSGKQLPLVGAVFGLGTAIGFLLGNRAEDLPSTEALTEPDVVDDLTEEATEAADDLEEPAPATDSEGGSRLPKLVLAALAILAAVAVRRRLTSEDDEWEPIEEFEPADTEERDPQRPDAAIDSEEAEPGDDEEIEE